MTMVFVNYFFLIISKSFLKIKNSVPLNIWLIFPPKFWKKISQIYTRKNNIFPKEKNWSKKGNKNLSKKKSMPETPSFCIYNILILQPIS
jgi:hypothetical protein